MLEKQGQQSTAKKLSTGRWSELEVEVLLNTVKTSKSVYAGCKIASNMLRRTEGACYQKYMIATNQIKAGVPVFKPKKGQDLLKTIELESNPKVIAEVINESVKDQKQDSVKKRVITIQISID